MGQIRRLACPALIAGITLIGAQVLAGENLVSNGGFEEGAKSWNWGQWKGLPEPGFLNRETPYKGRASYCMTLAGVEGTRSLICNVNEIDPTKDCELRVALRGERLRKNGVSISLLQWGTEKSAKPKPQSWITPPDRAGERTLIAAGGTFGWREFRAHVYRQSIKPTTRRFTLYIRNASIGEGELGIDEVSLVQVEPVAYRKPAAAKGIPPAREERTQGPQPIRKHEAPPGGESKEVLLHGCDSKEGWNLNLGKEFYGAKGELTTAREDGREVLKVVFDLSGGGHYVGAQFRAKIGKADGILFEIRPARVHRFSARIRDATGQTHLAGFSAAEGAWLTISLPLTTEKFSAHWGGAKDGKIHFPLQRVLIAARPPKGGTGEFLLRNLAARVPGVERTWKITVATDQPGHIHFIEEPGVDVAVRILNVLREERTAPVTVKVVDLDGKTVTAARNVTRFRPWAAEIVKLSLDSPGPGYYRVDVSIGQGEAQEKGEGAFGVVHRPLRYRRRDPESFFGIHAGDPEIAARIGVHWERHYHKWRWGEPVRGVYEHPTEHLRRFVDAGIDIMMCLNYQEPGWLKPRTGPDGLPTEEGIRRFAEFVRSSVRAHPFVGVFEIQNEPDLGFMAHRNLSLEKGVEFYTRIAKTIAPIIRAEAPGTPIAGCNVSGMDQKAGFPFSRSVLKQVGRTFDIWAPHPYASPRTFGPGLSPLSPEDNRETEKHRGTLAVIREFGGRHRYWIGEKGWEIQDAAPLFGRNSLSFADYAGRSLIIAKSVPGVEKYFWFMQSMEFNTKGRKYPLFRGRPLQPMPAALAYANVAYRLDHARPIESLRFAGGGVRVCVFERPMTDTAVAALWSLSTPCILEATLPNAAEVFDLYGRRLAADQLELTETPLFVQTAATQVKSLLSALKSARFEPAQPFEVVAAYLANVQKLRIGLRNNTSKVVRVEARTAGKTARVALLPNREEATWLDVALPEGVTTRRNRPLPLTLAPREGKPVELSIPTDLSPVARRPGITVDAKPQDWRGLPVIALKARENVLPPDEAGWMGPDDLSMRVSLAWDETNLYLLVRVTDDVHCPTGPGQFWKKDCLQIALDVMNDAGDVAGFDADDREYGVQVHAGNAHTFRTQPRRARFDAEFPAAGRRAGDETVYELALPWSELGREPRAGMVLSLNLTANDNDGAGMNYWMGITPGIVEGKRPGQYRDFYLTK